VGLGIFPSIERESPDDDAGILRRIVPDPMPMRNTRGAVVYYLFFASPNATGAKIVSDIFNKYPDRGAS